MDRGITFWINVLIKDVQYITSSGYSERKYYVNMEGLT